MNVVWLIQNLVPYHHARFEAFAARFKGEAHLIQVTDLDEFNVLEFKATEQSYTLHTLFPGRQRNSLTSKELRSGLDRCLQSIDPECVCVSGWGMEIGWMMQLWSIRHNIPAVMFSESTSYDLERTRWKEWIKTQLVKASSAALVGGTPHAEYIQQLGMDASAVSLGHNVVDSSHFSVPAEERPSSLPETLEYEPYFVACTRFGLKKNLPSLVRAYAVYADQCKQASRDCYRLVIAGDGALRDEIEAAVVDQNLGDQLILLGAVDYASLPWLYQNCQAFVHASTTEQWGLVVNEAMAAGAPVLVTRRCGCAPDLVHEAENGFQLDPYSESDISGVLWKFANLPDDQKRTMGESSKIIIEEWGPERFADGLESAVDVALATRAKPNSLTARMLIHFLLSRGTSCE